MDEVVARKLRPWEGRKLQKLKRQLSSAANRLHARVILLSRGGVRNAEIADRCGWSPAWVRAIIHRFNDGGVGAVTWYPYYCHRGGPRKFFAGVTERTAEAALSPPGRLIGMSVWSLPKVRDYLVEQKVVHAPGVQDGLPVRGVLVGRDQPRHPAPQPVLHVRDQFPDLLGRPLAGDGTQHQPVLGVERHVVPVVAPAGVGRVSRVDVLLLLADERPLLVELQLAGPGGKRRPTRRATPWRGRPPAGRTG